MDALIGEGQEIHLGEGSGLAQYDFVTGDDEVLDCGVGGVARNYPLLIPGKFTE
jgi:hypothetical protein